MAHKRISDIKVKTQFRSERMLEENGQWFFHTREETIEGPFGSKLHAESQLEAYIRVQISGLLSGKKTYSLNSIEPSMA